MSLEDFVNTLTDDQRQALLEALIPRKELETANEVKSKVVNEAKKILKKVNKDFTVTRPKDEKPGRVPVRAKENTWKDEKDVYPDDEFPQKRERIQRDRKAVKKVELECSVCGRTFFEHPSSVYGEYHRCNRCVGR